MSNRYTPEYVARIRQAAAICRTLGIPPAEIEAYNVAREYLKQHKGSLRKALDTLQRVFDDGAIDQDLAIDVDKIMRVIASKK